jgi:nucleoside 2-deoxyribosyltransferase
MVIAVLDGSQVDDGTAWETGYYYALRRGKIIGSAQTNFTVDCQKLSVEDDSAR